MANKESVKTYYIDNRIGSGQHCECGQELTWEQYNHQRQHKHKMCGKCMNGYCDHAMTGE